MTDQLSRLAGPVDIAAGDSVLFTGVTAHTYTVIFMSVVNNTDLDIGFKLGINGITDDKLVLPAITIEARGMLTFGGRMVFRDLDTLMCNASANGMTFTMSGADQS